MDTQISLGRGIVFLICWSVVCFFVFDWIFNDFGLINALLG